MVPKLERRPLFHDSVSRSNFLYEVLHWQFAKCTIKVVLKGEILRKQYMLVHWLVMHEAVGVGPQIFSPKKT